MDLDGLFLVRPGRTRRSSSYDRSGGNRDAVRVGPGERATLLEADGPGVVRHIWMTLASPDPMIRRHAVLQAWWDGETEPSVLCPLGDFFGQGWGERYPFQALPLAAAPRGGQALVAYFPMPFSHARIVLENQSAQPIDALYFYVDYELVPSLPPEAGRFHASWRRELTDPGECDPEGRENEWGVLGPTPDHANDLGNYVLLEAEGRGHVVGVQYYVDNPSPIWYGEGDDMWLVDGEPWPGSLHGTGTEDFLNGAWSPNEPFSHPYFGYARVPQGLGWLGRTHGYRFFLTDPIRFERSIRGSLEHGHANCLTLDLATVVYWYQTEPHRPLPPLPPPEARGNLPPIDVREVHRWRDAWRRARGGGKLWGHEA